MSVLSRDTGVVLEAGSPRRTLPAHGPDPLRRMQGRGHAPLLEGAGDFVTLNLFIILTRNPELIRNPDSV